MSHTSLNSADTTILGLISFQAACNPDHIAIQHNGIQVSYADLEMKSDRIAACFLSGGFESGDIIAVAMDRSIDMSLCLLGLLKAGITYLPIDPKLPLERVKFLLQDSAAVTLVTTALYSKLYEELNTNLFEQICADKMEMSTDKVSWFSEEEQVAYIIYTSGSTGSPKGVGITQKSLLNLLLFRRESPGVDHADNMLGITTMSFDISQEELYLPLVCGGKLTIVDDDIAKDGEALLEVIRKERITIMQATPYVWQMMLEAGWEEKLPLKAFCGGEALTKKLASQLLVRCKELWNMYGPTETTICCIVKKLSLDDDVITIGKPIANTQVYILDEDQNEVSTGGMGEIYIGGVGVSRGYINRPELTAEKFIDDKFSAIPGRKIYKTGDLGKVYANGDFQFLGRIDSQIKIRGYRIETEEIEYHIREHESIKDALVSIHVDAVDNLRLVAYFTPKDITSNQRIEALKLELKDRLKKVLPDYMVPSDYLAIKSMPLLPSGKVDKKKLPAPDFKTSGAFYVAPVTALEKMITQIWIENIGIEQIGIEDNFFELGGTSMIAVKTKIQIEKVTNKRLRPSILFKYPTIRQLAIGIMDDARETFKSLVPIKPEGNKIPLYIVHGIGLNVLNFRGLAYHMDDQQPIYGLQAVDADDPIDPLFSIEDIAAFYNSEITMHNPLGPYAIAGYSIGGVIAYEMVKQLKTQGKDVRFLAMFDTAIQIPTHQYPLPKKLYYKGLRQFFKAKFRLSSFVKQPGENVKYVVDLYRRKFKKIFLNQIETYGLPEYMTKTVGKMTDAFYRYKVVPADLLIDVFVTEKLYFLDDPESLGWRKYARQGINVHKVSSHHDDMFASTHIAELAAKLQTRLNEIQ